MEHFCRYANHDGIVGDAWTARTIESMREDGWMIGIHNDYRYGGVPHTFYLFTHPSGIWAKGEGTSDFEAVMEAAIQAADRLDDGPARRLAAGAALAGAVKEAIRQKANLDASPDDESSWCHSLLVAAQTVLSA